VRLGMIVQGRSAGGSFGAGELGIRLGHSKGRMDHRPRGSFRCPWAPCRRPRGGGEPLVVIDGVVARGSTQLC